MPNDIRVGSDAENEACDYLVCTPVSNPLKFADNLVSVCCKCGAAVQYRPHAPIIPPKICLPCIMPDLLKDHEKGELGVLVSDKTIQEVVDHFRRKNSN